MEVNNINQLTLIAMIVMVLISFANFFWLNIAGLAVIIGIIVYFIRRESLDGFKLIGKNLKNKRIWLWIFMPFVMNILCLALAILFLPEFIDHTYDRTQFALTPDKILLLIFQLGLFAYGEEVAWRGFFQRNLLKVLQVGPSIIVTSILFSIGHFAVGSFEIVSYDLFFIFINSIFYGIVFYKTNNVWISAISHFIANLFAYMMILLF